MLEGRLSKMSSPLACQNKNPGIDEVIHPVRLEMTCGESVQMAIPSIARTGSP